MWYGIASILTIIIAWYYTPEHQHTIELIGMAHIILGAVIFSFINACETAAKRTDSIGRK